MQSKKRKKRKKMPKLKIKFKNGNTAEYKFVDNLIGETMHDLIDHVLQNDDTLHNQHGSFPALTDFNEILDLLKQRVEEANSKGLNIPSVPDNIDQESLSRIHEAFHLVEEQYQATGTHDLSLNRCLRDINSHVHALETSISSNNHNYQVFQIGATHFHKRQVIDAVRRQYFKHETFDPCMSKLSVGYATIGKNLLHCTIDNDKQLVKDNHLRPQLSMSTETVWSHSSMGAMHPNPVARWERHCAETKDWVVKNKLTRHVGYEDPIHLYSIQPTYAIGIGDCESWTDLEWFNSWITDGGVERFELN